MYNTIFIYKSSNFTDGKTDWKLEIFTKFEKTWFKINFIIQIGMNIVF
jgi:hypothetical protein